MFCLYLKYDLRFIVFVFLTSHKVYIQTEYWAIFKHFIQEHHLERFTLLLDADMDDDTNLFLVQATTNLFNRFCSVFIPTLLKRKYPLNSLGLLAQSPINVLSADYELWNDVQNENNTDNESKENGNDIDIDTIKRGMCYSLISPFFDINSIHLETLDEFNLYLPNPVPLQDMLDLIQFILDSKHRLTKFRLELQMIKDIKENQAIIRINGKICE